jgi:hypothetical protein
MFFPEGARTGSRRPDPRIALGRGGDFPYNRRKRRFSAACREIQVKLHRSSYLLTALVVAGALTFLVSLARRKRILSPLPYSGPAGGEREGEFELFIGS